MQTIEVNVFGNKKTFELPSSLRLLEKGEKIPDNCDVIRLLHQEYGDIRIVWNAYDIGQISDAKDTFDKLIEAGMVPYLVSPETGKAERIIDEFDPFAEEIMMKDDHRRPHKRKEVIATPQGLLAGG